MHRPLPTPISFLLALLVPAFAAAGTGCDAANPSCADSVGAVGDEGEKGGEDRGEPVDLAFAEDWVLTASAAEDPLGDHRPADFECAADGWGEEFGVFEVRTAECPYLSVEQPLAAPIREGEPLRVGLWWQNLIAHEPATGHLALLVDGELLWELEVEIPGSSDARTLEFPSPITADAGSTLTFHLHNHGQNSWTLAEFARVGPAPAAPCH